MEEVTPQATQQVTEWSSVLPVSPQAKQRPRVNRNGITWTPENTRTAEMEIRHYLLHRGAPKLEGPLEVVLTFNLVRPKSITEKKRPWPAVKSDLDNYIKLVCDAANSILWPDDSAICILHATKQYAETASIEITVRVIKK